MSIKIAEMPNNFGIEFTFIKGKTTRQYKSIASRDDNDSCYKYSFRQHLPTTSNDSILHSFMKLSPFFYHDKSKAVVKREKNHYTPYVSDEGTLRDRTIHIEVPTRVLNTLSVRNTKEEFTKLIDQLESINIVPSSYLAKEGYHSCEGGGHIHISLPS